MEDIYNFMIESDEFEKVLNGKKTVHLVINSPKRKVYAVGNQITFCKNIENLSDEQKKELEESGEPQRVDAEISNLLYFADAREAVETLGRETCGFRPSATFEKASDIFLAGDSFETVEKYGIVAIAFELKK